MSVHIEILKEQKARGPLGLADPDAKGLDLRIDGEAYYAILSRDEIARGDLRWHISLSRRADLGNGDEVPLWRVLVAVAHKLRPGVAFIVPVPPENCWMNQNPNVLHVNETKDINLVANWRLQANAVRGTPAARPT